MMVSSNAPVMINRAVVMPGDVVLGSDQGVIFIPAHLAQQVVEDSELIRLKDEFTQENILKGRNIYGTKWDDETRKEYVEWLRAREDKLTTFQRKILIEEQDF